MAAVLLVPEREIILADLDAKIFPLVNNKNELETEVFEAEEIQSKIVEMVSNINYLCYTEVTKCLSPSPKSKIPDPAVVTLSCRVTTNNRLRGTQKGMDHYRFPMAVPHNQLLL